MEITAERLNEVALRLSSLPGEPARAAVKNSLERAMITVRSEGWNYAKRIYTVNRTTFYRETRINIRHANLHALVADVSFSGHVIPLVNYLHSWSYTNSQGETVSRVWRASHRRGRGRYNRSLEVEVMNGNRYMLNAFKANFGKYGDAIYERLSSKRNDVQQMYGPSTAHMMENPEVIQKLDKAAKETFDKRIEHEIDRLLRGFGGGYSH